MSVCSGATIKSPLCNFIFRKCCRKLYSIDAKVQPQAIKDSGPLQIDIPYRIERSSTDILKALESTLKKDFTAPKYKYNDDPYFIPISNITKRSFALSKEAGKKAARYFLEKYPELFIANKSEPFIQAYEPPIIYKEEDNVTEETLKSCIKSVDVANCIAVYELLKNKGVELSNRTKQLLLEIFCFYNSTIPLREDYVEEKWFTRKESKFRNTWINGGFAEQLFEEMDKDYLAYSTMIQGTSKYGCHDKAFILYQEACDKNFPVTLEAYNGLLTLVPFVKEDGDFRWDHAMEIVKNMNSEHLIPDLNTMNALLGIISSSRRWFKGKAVASQLLAEMKRLNIEPSLGTYYFLLQIFYGNRPTSVLPQIMDKLDGKEFEICHSSDVMFFHHAMEICYKIEKNKDLAYRVHSFLEFENNYKFLSSALFEAIYFQNFFNLLAAMEDFDKFIEIYDKYVPNTYTPETNVMLNIITALDFNAAYHHLPKLCSDMMLFELTEREEVLSELLKVSASIKLAEKEQGILMELLWNIMTKIDSRMEKSMRRTFQWSGAMLGNILTICLNGNDLEKSWILMQRLKNEEFSVVGYPEENCLIEFCKKFLELKDFFKVEYCVQYAAYTTYSILKKELFTFVEDKVQKQLYSEEERKVVDEILRQLPDHKETNEKSAKVEQEM